MSAISEARVLTARTESLAGKPELQSQLTAAPVLIAPDPHDLWLYAKTASMCLLIIMVANARTATILLVEVISLISKGPRLPLLWSNIT